MQGELTKTCLCLKGEIDFWSLKDRERKECMYLFCKYISFADLYQFAFTLSKDDPIKMMNNLWRKNNPYAMSRMKRFENTLHDHQLDEFTYNYVCLKYLRKEKVSVRLSKEYTEDLRKLRSALNDYLLHVPVRDIITFIHHYGDKMEYHHVIKYYCDNKANGDVHATMKEIFGDDYALYSSLIDKYIRENSIETTTINGKHEEYTLQEEQPSNFYPLYRNFPDL